MTGPAGATAPRTVVRCPTAADTRALGARLASVARAGDRISLLGPLGAGKTELAKGFAAGLGVTAVVDSPSFTLMAEYQGRLPLFHLDLYRLVDAAEALDGGLLDEREADGVTLIEWGDRLPAEVDPDRLEVRLFIEPDEARSIEVAAATAEQARFVTAVAPASPGGADGA